MNFNHFINTDLYQDIDENKVYKALSDVVKCKTISHTDQSLMDFSEFSKLHNILKESFPNVTSKANIEIINQGSMLYYIEGSNKSLKPILLMAHLDVVGVIEATLNEWNYPPFSGEITDEFIYGRGTEDIKSMAICYLSALEYLFNHGKELTRGIYLAFGHDEETLGGRGQLQIKNILESRNVELEVVLDEGGGIEKADAYKVDSLLATINVMEKGYLDLKISATSCGGHSSKPGFHTSLGRVAKAITQLEENQFKPKLNGVVRKTFEVLAPYINDSKLKKYASDIDRYEQELVDYIYNDENLAPLVYTTTAATMLEGGSKGANVLPGPVYSIVNFRLLDSVEECMKHFSNVITDENITIENINSIDASKISNINSSSYNVLENTIKTFYKDVIVVPGLICGGTDCRFYNDICDNCYRFDPVFNDFEKCHNVHAVNERCQKKALLHGVKFIIYFIEQMCL